MLPKATAFSPSLSSRAMRSKVGPWKRGEHEAMTKWSRPRSSTAFSIIVRPSVPHMNWLTLTSTTPSSDAGVLGQRLEVDDAADVAAALAEKDPGPHLAPPASFGLPGADALEERLDVLGVRLDADHLLGVGAERQRQELLHVQVDEGELLAGALGDDVAVAVELDVAVGAHVHQHVDVLLVQPVQLLLRHRDGDRRVDEAVAEAGPAVRLLLVVGAGADDAGGDEHLLRHHEVLVVAQGLVREDLAVVAGGVRGDLDAVEAPADETGHAVVGAPQDLEGVLVLHRGGDAVVVLAADLGQHLVGLGAVARDVEDVARLLVDRVAGGAEVAHHGVLVVDHDAGVARGDADGGLDRHEVGVVAEAGAAGLRRIDRVLDAEALEEPLGGRLDARVLGADQAAAEERDAPSMRGTSGVDVYRLPMDTSRW